MRRTPWIRAGGPRRRKVKQLAVVLALGALGYYGLGRGAAPPPYPAAAYLLDRTGQPLRVVPGPDGFLCDPITLEDTGPWAWKALVAVEDKRFFRHPGVDPLAILRAAAQNTAGRRVVSGASTLTTQIIRMTEPRPRTLRTKAIEAFEALRLESAMSKEEILVQYLNRAPLGGNLVGVQAASRAYFRKDAADLSLAEASLLMGLPQAPSRYRPDRHPARAAARQRKVLERMEACGFITAEQRDTALSTAAAADRDAPPFQAPHFCDLVLRRLRGGMGPAPTTGSGRLRTTLDPTLQAITESAVQQYRDALAARGIDGAAAVIVDVCTGDVLAMVGSPDFFAEQPGAQVNAANVRRSPGSTLKPLIYAAAIDRGAWIPDTILSDRPLAYADYRPLNMDHAYRGDVTLRDALQLSLNIPVLHVAQALGIHAVVASLREFGLSTLDQAPESYGLSVALGSAEVTLLDLATAYAALARGGVWKPYRLMLDEPVSDGRRVLASPASAYLVSSMLEIPAPRTLPIEAGAGGGEWAGAPRAAWKTGTSSGGRDAWTIAYNPEVVVGVWVGTLSGPAPIGATGIRDASPVAFQILRRIVPDGQGPWFERPPEIVDRDLCPAEGRLAGHACPARIPGPMIAGVSTPGLCSAHTPTPGSAPQPLPSLHITSPLNGSTYHRTRGLPADRQQIPLLANTEASATLHWFINGVHLNRHRQGDTVMWPLQRGTHVIACADERGQADQVRITVE